MAGSTGCHDDCAAMIIYIFNAVALILSFAGLGGTCYLSYKEASRQPGDFTMGVFIPETVAVFSVGIFICLLVIAIAFLGIITTALELKASQIAESKKEQTVQNDENEEAKQDKNGKLISKKKKEPKACCHNRGLLVYIGMCFFSFVFMLVVVAVSGVYSGQLDHIDYESEVKNVTKENAWIDSLKYQLPSSVFVMFNKYPDTWNKSQAALGCCGWNVTDDQSNMDESEKNANVMAYTKDSKCCKDLPAVTDINVHTKGLKRDEHGCWVTGDRKSVYTCQAIVIKYIRDNMTIFCSCTMVLAIVQFSLGIAGCVVRFPRLYRCCGWICCCCCCACCQKEMSKYGNAKVAAYNYI